MRLTAFVATQDTSWFFIAVLLVLPLEALFGSERGATWPQRFANVGAMLVHAVVGGLVLEALLTTAAGQRLVAFPREPRHAWLRNPIAWALVSVSIIDGVFYIYHRLQHGVPLFWRIHKLHHTDPAINVTTAKRMHFLERALQYFCLSVPMFWVLGRNLEGFAYAAAINWFFLAIGHADIRLDFGPLTPVVVGPQFHRLHHSRLPEHRDVNFAQVLPLFDLLGGTYRRPGPDEYPETGVEGCETPYARWRPLLW